MKPENIIAHRGFWVTPDEKNTARAFTRAWEGGFSIETDFRDSAGTLVIAHDPPGAADRHLSAEAFFAMQAASADAACYAAINVKADGLLSMLSRDLAAAGLKVGRSYAFDMSIPDMSSYLAQKFPTFTRESEYELTPAFLEAANGTWVDNFGGDFPQVERAALRLSEGHRIAIVSAELHGRPHIKLWEEIRAAGLHERDGFSICTDFPNEALEFFAGKA